MGVTEETGKRTEDLFEEIEGQKCPKFNKGNRYTSSEIKRAPIGINTKSLMPQYIIIKWSQVPKRVS